MAHRGPVPGLPGRDREGDPMNGNRRAVRVLAITSRRRSMHGYAASLCMAFNRPAASLLASGRKTLDVVVSPAPMSIGGALTHTGDRTPGKTALLLSACADGFPTPCDGGETP